jgi:hypothetical protein
MHTLLTLTYFSYFVTIPLQWGGSSYGYVAFPISFTTFRKIMLTHQGAAFMIVKFNESYNNDGFTLSVRDMDGGIDIQTGYDSQWFAIGK